MVNHKKKDILKFYMDNLNLNESPKYTGQKWK